MKKLIAAMLFIPTMAHAEFFTGNQLLEKLKDVEAWSRMQALGYIQGVFDANMSITICPPSGVTAGQVNDMIKNYLENTPAIRNRTADRIIQDALKSVWPCQNRNPARGA